MLEQEIIKIEELEVPEEHKQSKEPEITTKFMCKKTPCVSEEVSVVKTDNRCQFCYRTYISKGNLTRHQKTCDKNKNTNIEALMKLMMEKIDTIYDEKREMIKMMKQRI